MRIHKLAKDLGIENKVLVEFLQKQGADVKSHMSSCPEELIDVVMAKFGKKEAPAKKEAEEPKKPEIKVVAVPDFIAKEEPKTVPTRTADGEKIEDGGKQIAKVEAKKAQEAKGKETEEPKKKKKIIAVFNPQHSNSEKGRAMAKAQRDEQRKKTERPQRPLPSQLHPARDRKPDDEPVVKKPLPSQVRPAKDRIPDDELAEMQAKKKAEQELAAAKEKEKAEVMTDFKERRYDCLVSTTVIEVGVDVPNATIMIIYNAERFGLSQLHQLRGRVGRGDEKSYCFLLMGTDSETARERLTAIKSTTDGFKIAEKDLEMRGSGDFFGTRQSGKMLSDIKNLRYSTEIIFVAKRLTDEAFEGRYDTEELRMAAIKKYNALKDVVLN